MKHSKSCLLTIASLALSVNQSNVIAQFAWDGDCSINWHDCCVVGANVVNNWTIPGNPSTCPALPGVTDTVYLSQIVDSGAATIGVGAVYQSGTFLCRAQTLTTYNGDIITSGTPDDPGTFRLAGGIVNLLDGVSFDVGSFSTLDIWNGVIRPIGNAPYAQLLTISGLGTLTRTSASRGTIAQIDVPINNQGLITVPFGSLHLFGGGISTGEIEVLGGATVRMQGTMTLDGEVHGDGLAYFGGGSTSIVTDDYHPASTFIGYGNGPHTVNFEADNAIDNLEMSNSGNLGGAADLAIDDLTWYGGSSTMLPGGTVSVQDTAVFQGVSSPNDLQRDLELHGISTLTPTTTLRMLNAELRNHGNLELQGNASIQQFGSTPNAGVKNFSMMRKTGGGVSQMSVILSNVGPGAAVHIESGTLTLDGDMASEGPITVNAGATLMLWSGQQSVFPSGSITGAGTVKFNSGFAQVDVVEGVYDIPITEIWGGTVQFQANGLTGTLHLYGGALAGDGDLTVTNQLNWWNAAFMSGLGATRILDQIAMHGNGYLQRRLVLDDLDSIDTCNPCPQGMLNVVSSGELRGNGTIQGNVAVHNGGLVSPGGAVQSSGTTLHITGNFTHYANGQLRIDLADASTHDQLLVAGAASISGALTVTGSPPNGQSFTILTAASVAGAFAPVNLPNGMTITYTANAVILQSAPGVPCPADIAPIPAGDNAVNVSDLLAVISAWGACPGCPADINGDNVVNVTDLLAVISAWGACP